MKRKSVTAWITAGLMCLACSSGQMLSGSASGTVRGDVNGDGVLNTVDVILLQKWLHAVPGVHLADWKTADFHEDSVLNVFDLCLMKQTLLKQNMPQENKGKIYQKIKLTDQQVGVTAFEGILPEGWTAQIQSSWAMVNDYPGLESVVFISPDGKAAVQILSPQAYVSNAQYGNMVSVSNFTTYFNYRNAPDYLDYCAFSNYSDAKLIQEIETDEAFQKSVSDYAYLQAQGLAMYIQQSGMNWSVTGYEGTVARRQYQSSQSYLEYSCAVPAYEYMMNRSDNIKWEVLNSVAYEATDEESFRKYYDDYEMIVSNGGFTAEFYSAVNYVLNVIVQAKANALISENTGLNASAGYSSSGTEITDSDRATQERVMQAWDDYIREEDRYTTTEGNTVITSMYHETVAQDGNYFYVGSVTDVPEGYTILTRQ